MRKFLVVLDDSRECLNAMRFAALRAAHASGLVEIGVGAASATEIGRINILRATHLAMRRAVAKLPKRPDHALVDGNQPPPLGRQDRLADDVAVGRMTSGAYGHTLGRSVGIAAIDPTASLDATFTVECKGVRVPATVSRRPFYDPRGERLRG